MAGFFNFFHKRQGQSLDTSSPKPPQKYPSLDSRRSRGTAASPQIPAEPLTAGYVQDFIDGEYTTVVSSNVYAMQYFHEDQKLMVEFIGKKGKSNSAYLYSNVSEQEAFQAITAASHGGWVWSALRVRGSKTAHQKPFVRIK